MSYDAIFQYRKNSSTQCRIRPAGARLYLGRSRRVIDQKVRAITPTGLPLSPGSAGNRWAGVGYFTVYPDHDQNARGRSDSTSIACANQWTNHWRNCGASHRQFSRQAAPPWLIAIGEVMTLSWTMLLIVCMPLNWSKSLPFWYRTVNVELTKRRKP